MLSSIRRPRERFQVQLEMSQVDEAAPRPEVDLQIDVTDRIGLVASHRAEVPAGSWRRVGWLRPVPYKRASSVVDRPRQNPVERG
ncbi:MAG: hypothetical protein M3024_07130 [Candidatus Dormibacteraeota bacterium]|nr:hypothetical protein [Candidatus Dormibacteraeota bacterium]